VISHSYLAIFYLLILSFSLKMSVFINFLLHLLSFMDSNFFLFYLLSFLLYFEIHLNFLFLKILKVILIILFYFCFLKLLCEGHTRFFSLRMSFLVIILSFPNQQDSHLPLSIFQNHKHFCQFQLVAYLHHLPKFILLLHFFSLI
jgi:hypothetical protein